MFFISLYYLLTKIFTQDIFLKRKILSLKKKVINHMS